MSNISVNFPISATGLDDVQNRNPSAISTNEQSVALFDDLMNASAEDFQSKIKNLPEFQQQQIQEGLKKHADSLNSALDALNAVSEQPQLDMSRLEEDGYGDEYFKKSQEYAQKSGAAISKTQEAVDAGIALLDTLEGIDPTLAKAPPLPDQGKNLIILMNVLGSSPQQIDRIANAFGLSQ
jgi:TolA-binding protein